MAATAGEYLSSLLALLVACVPVDGSTLMHTWETLGWLLKKGGREMKLGAGCAGDPGAIEGCGEYEQNTLDRCIKFPTNKKGYLKLMPSSFP